MHEKASESGMAKELDLLLKEKTIYDIANQIKERIRNGDSFFFIYGCGCNARRVAEISQKCGANIDAFVIDDEYYTFDTFMNTDVIKYSDWISDYSDRKGFVWIGVNSLSEAERIRARLPVEYEYIHTMLPLEAYRATEFLDIDYLRENIDKFKRTYDILADAESKNVMYYYIKGCISGDAHEMINLPQSKQYFNSLVPLEMMKDIVIIDCGAYDGDSASDAINYFGKDTVNKIYSFEPDKENYSRMLTRIESDCDLKEKVVPCMNGVGIEKTTACFNSLDSGSSVSVDGDERIEIETIDNIFLNQRVDFIKMDIEGEEKNALLGGKDTIKNNNPILAICAYHKKEDLFELVSTIEEIVDDDVYNYYLRHHDISLNELVLYAIPKRYDTHER